MKEIGIFVVGYLPHAFVLGMFPRLCIQLFISDKVKYDKIFKWNDFVNSVWLEAVEMFFEAIGVPDEFHAPLTLRIDVEV